MKARGTWHCLPAAIMDAGPGGISSVELAAQFEAGSRDISDALSRTRRKLRQRGGDFAVYTLLDIGFPARYFGTQEWRDAAEAQRGPMQSHIPKEPSQKKASPKPQSQPLIGPIVGPIPAAVVLPHAPVYSRHQLTDLPEGWQSPLNASECRPWAMAASR